jgi:hypothetical protein
MKRLLLPYLNNFVVWLIPKNIVIEFLNQKKIQKTITILYNRNTLLFQSPVRAAFLYKLKKLTLTILHSTTLVHYTSS